MLLMWRLCNCAVRRHLTRSIHTVNLLSNNHVYALQLHTVVLCSRLKLKYLDGITQTFGYHLGDSVVKMSCNRLTLGYLGSTSLAPGPYPPRAWV